jgi:hypothetical protein
MSREVTCKILDLLDQGILDRDVVVQACLAYMGEDEVEDMARINGLFESLEDEKEEEDEEYDPIDDFNYVGSRHHY